MNDKKLIICKNIDISMDGAESITYQIIAKEPRMNRDVAMITLTLEELETYVNTISTFLDKEKGGLRWTE